MIKAKVYNLEGQVTGEKELNPKFFEVKTNQDLIHQVVVAQQANSRQTFAHAKGRADVRGGGRKPWRQKGTGRARHGSIRSPIWRGGGVIFGPTKEKVFAKKINKKMKRKALLMCLSDRAFNERLILIDDLRLPEIKTRQMAGILNKLPLKNKTVLVALSDSDQKVVKSTRNLSQAKTIRADSLNVMDVLKHEYLLMPVEAVEVVEKTYKL
ncbi:MAG TPA: 50S ribosomal protein L4 [Patescibacteria group bacterium]